MSRLRRVVGLAALLLVLLVLPGFQGTDKLAPAQTGEMLSALGLEPKTTGTEAGKERYEIKITKDNLDIPVSVEHSASGSFVWLTVHLGAAPGGDRTMGLLKQNASSQPCHFYVNKSDRLMMGLAVDNRGITNAILRERIDMLVGQVTGTKALWQ
jgi:hypothetical protein